MSKNETINDRVEWLISANKLNKNSFGVKTGISAPIVANIVGGRKNKPSFPIIEKILLAFPEVNPTWLITGKGEKLIAIRPMEIEPDTIPSIPGNPELEIGLLRKEIKNLKSKIEVSEKYTQLLEAEKSRLENLSSNLVERVVVLEKEYGAINGKKEGMGQELARKVG